MTRLVVCVVYSMFVSCMTGQRNLYTHIRALFSALAVSSVALCASPVRADSAASSSSATIIQPTTLASLLELNFGTIATNAAGGVVSLDVVSSNRNCASGLFCSGSFAFATLYITGSISTVQVTYDPDVVLTGPGAPMDVTILFPGGSGTVVNLVNGEATIQFGADLTVNPNQIPGGYTGQFTVNVDYQ
jgi:hypothetical protein